MNEIYTRRRDLVVETLREIGVEVQPPKGTIYVWAPVPEGHTSVSFAELVLEEAAVVVSPGSMYGPSGEGFFRISLTTPDERLTEGARADPPAFELAGRAILPALVRSSKRRTRGTTAGPVSLLPTSGTYPRFPTGNVRPPS